LKKKCYDCKIIFYAEKEEKKTAEFSQTHNGRILCISRYKLRRRRRGSIMRLQREENKNRERKTMKK
jgi:hypothetical protein